MQAAITLKGSGAEAWETGARVKCEAGFPLCLINVDAPRCWARSQVTGAEVLDFGSELALFPLSVCSSPSQLLHPAVLEQEGLLWVVSKVWGWVVAVWLLSEIQTASGVSPVQLQIMAALSLLRHHLGFELLQISQSSFLAGCTSPCSSVEL